MTTIITHIGGDGLKAIEDSDMDSLFILPLSIIPLQTVALSRARLIKNVRLKSVVETFSDVQTGSGQIEIEDLPALLDWPTDSVHPDLTILRRLAMLPSYDVFSLRISLREAGIPVNDFAALRLTPEKAKELTQYMTMFTRPLIRIIYGEESVNINSFEDVVKLFRDPDVRKAKARLEVMAKSLNISVLEVPRFLEDYGDTFLALSYFRHALDRLGPYTQAVLDSLPPIRKHFQLKQDANLMRVCDTVERVVNEVSANITGKFEVFDRRTKEMWGNISETEFRAAKDMIERYHVTIGATLCGLTVKMNAWARIFPRPTVGGPIKRADFLVSEMMHSIENIMDIEKRYHPKR